MNCNHGVSGAAAGLWILAVSAAAASPAAPGVSKPAPAPGAQAAVFDRVEIKVGSEIITTTDLEEPIRQWEEQNGKKLGEAEFREKRRELREQLAKRLIESKLLLLEARAQDVKIQDAMVEEEARKEVDALREQFGSAEKFEKELAREHLTPDELERQREMLVRENLMRQRLMQSKIQELKTNAEISDEQSQKYYQDHPKEFQRPARARVSQIFVARPDTGLKEEVFAEKDRQARQKINSAWNELKQGKDFSAVARSVSEHKPTAEGGGEIGWIESGDTGLPEFEKAVFSDTEVGKFSGVLSTARGYFIVLVEERQPGGVLPLEEVRGRIRQKMMAEGSEKRLQAWVDSLREKYPVTVLGEK